MEGSLKVLRDCPATRIPSGEQVIIPQGTEFQITQSLGGSHTVRVLDGLFRIQRQDADALGLNDLEASEQVSSSSETKSQAVSPVREEEVWGALRNCYDPEIPVNIVDLGLVYDLRLEQTSSGRSRVGVKMTLTAPGCGMGATIAGDAQQKILDLDGVEDAQVEIVWDPPWHHSMITPAGRAQLGLDQ